MRRPAGRQTLGYAVDAGQVVRARTGGVEPVLVRVEGQIAVNRAQITDQLRDRLIVAVTLTGVALDRD